MARKIKIIRFIPAVLWCIIIFYLSSIPGLKSPFGLADLFLRKGAHVTEYLILNLLVLYGLGSYSLKERLIAVIFSAVYAVSDEYHQSFVPGRSMEIADMCWDWIGCFLGYIVVIIKHKE